MVSLTFELNDAEKKLIEYARTGDIAEFSKAEPSALRAEVLISLAAGLRSDWAVHFHGVRVKGAQIEGELNLSGARINQPLEFLDCQFKAPISLDGSESRTIRLRGSRIPGLMASRLSIKGALDVSGLHCSGLIRMRDTRIDGVLDASDATFENPGEVSFDGTRMSVSGGFLVGKGSGGGFRSHGEFKLYEAQLGSFHGEDAVFENQNGYAIAADGLNVRTTLILRRVKALGAVRIIYASIGTTFECDGALFSNPGKPSLWADGLKTGSGVYLRNGFRSEGKVLLYEAEIKGPLNCIEASFDGREANGESSDGKKVLVNPLDDNGKIALRAEGATIRGGVLFNRSKVWGTLMIPRLRAAGLVLDDAILENGGGYALSAEGLVTEGPVHLRRLKAWGQLCFMYASIGSSFEADDAKLASGHEKTVLQMEGAKILGPILLRKGFCADEIINLRGAKVGGNLSLSSAEFGAEVLVERSQISGDLLCEKAKLSGRPVAFAGAKMQVSGTFIWRELSPVPEGIVILSNASVGRLIDDMKSWPSTILIDNFAYQSFEQGAPLASERLSWLRRQKKEEFSPQPYEQAVQVLRRMGHEKEARRIACAKQDDLRKMGKLGWPARIWSFFLGSTIGHGYQVWRALVILLAIIVIGALVFTAAYNGGYMTSVPPTASVKPPAFEPLAYSIDVCLPILDLQQKRYWLLLGRGNLGWLYRFYFWLHIGLGWLMTTLAITGLTGLVKKD